MNEGLLHERQRYGRNRWQRATTWRHASRPHTRARYVTRTTTTGYGRMWSRARVYDGALSTMCGPPFNTRYNPIAMRPPSRRGSYPVHCYIIIHNTVVPQPTHATESSNRKVARRRIVWRSNVGVNNDRWGVGSVYVRFIHRYRNTCLYTRGCSLDTSKYSIEPMKTTMPSIHISHATCNVTDFPEDF